MLKAGAAGADRHDRDSNKPFISRPSSFHCLWVFLFLCLLCAWVGFDWLFWFGFAWFFGAGDRSPCFTSAKHLPYHWVTPWAHLVFVIVDGTMTNTGSKSLYFLKSLNVCLLKECEEKVF